MSCPTEDAAKWEDYPDTVLEFPGASPLRIDLRSPVSDAARDELAALGLASTFAILTAENPCGENVEDAATGAEERALERRNDRRLSLLEADLQERGACFLPVEGVAPDGSYRERCVAVLVRRDEPVGLARRFSQLAIFWFDGHDFWLFPAEAREEPLRLPP